MVEIRATTKRQYKSCSIWVVRVQWNEWRYT